MRLIAVLLLQGFLLACTEQDRPAKVGESAVAVAETPVAVSNVTPDFLIDQDSGLVIDDHWELVKAHCSACHSPKLVTQNRGNRQNWLDMIRWMQETQGLWAFDTPTETAILDYLEKNYAPSAVYRRAPLSPALLPENPYLKPD